MLVLNFSHPLTDEQKAQIEGLTGSSIDLVLVSVVNFVLEKPFAEQVTALVESVGLSSTDWQTLPILVVPPELAAIATATLAELHGRMGYFPDVVRRRKNTANQWEVAEIVELQKIRERARASR